MLSGNGRLGPDPEEARPTVRLSALLSDLGRQKPACWSARRSRCSRRSSARSWARAGLGAGALAAGGMIAFSGWLALLAAAILGLSNALAPWLAALIVGILVVALGGGLVLFGKGRLKADALVPRRTLNSLREDEAWIRDQVS